MKYDDQGRLPEQEARTASETAPASGTLHFDAERYRHHVAHLDLPEARKVELLEAVWRIMRSFVDRACGDDPTQLARIAGDRRNGAREVGGPGAISSALTNPTHDDGGLAGTFRKCGEGD